MSLFTFGTAFNGIIGKALAIVKSEENTTCNNLNTEVESENQPPVPGSPTPTEPDSPRPSRELVSNRRYSSPTREQKPKVRSEIAKVYVGASPQTYFASHRAYENSRQLRMNPPRKLTRVNPPAVVAPAAEVKEVVRVKRKPLKRVEPAELVLPMPKMVPGRDSGRKRAREEEKAAAKAAEEAKANDDVPSVPKRKRIGHGILGHDGPARWVTTSLPKQTYLETPFSRPLTIEEGPSKELQSCLKGKSGAAKKERKVTFSPSTIARDEEKTTGEK